MLDVATDLIATYGLRRVSLADLASAAGVSRQSLYRWFGDRDGVARVVIGRERDRFVAAALAAAEGHDDLRSALRVVVETSLRMAEGHPVLNRLRTSDPEVLLTLLASADNVVTTTVSAVAVEFIHARVDDVDAERVAEAADLFTRLVVSYLVQPPSSPVPQTAAVVADVVMTVLNPSERPAYT